MLTNSIEELTMIWMSDTELTETMMYQIGILTPWLFLTTNVTETIGRFVIRTDGNRLTVFIGIVIVYRKSAFINEYLQFISDLRSRNVKVFINTEENASQIKLNFTHNNLNNCSFLQCDTFGAIDLSSENYQQKLLSANVSVNGFRVNVYSKSLFIRAIDFKGRLVIKDVKGDTNEYVSNLSLPTVITNGCFVLSIAALLVLIVIQRRHGLIDNIPSSNIENISISLVLSNGLFIIGSSALEITKLCYIIGITLHYLWLTVFTYMTLSVVWISTTLTRIRARKTTNSRISNRRKVLTLIGLVIPLVFVGSAIAVDVYGPSFWSSGYNHKVCFPNRYPANLVFFTGPIIISLTVNVFSLIYIIGRVCAVRLEAANIRKLIPYKDALVYLRIVAISGVMWFTGIIAAFHDKEWINYLFTLLCGLQGFFLSIGTLTSSKVRFKLGCKKSSTITN